MCYNIVFTICGDSVWVSGCTLCTTHDLINDTCMTSSSGPTHTQDKGCHTQTSTHAHTHSHSHHTHTHTHTLFSEPNRLSLTCMHTQKNTILYNITTAQFFSSTTESCQHQSDCHILVMQKGFEWNLMLAGDLELC